MAHISVVGFRAWTWARRRGLDPSNTSVFEYLLDACLIAFGTARALIGVIRIRDVYGQLCSTFVDPQTIASSHARVAAPAPTPTPPTTTAGSACASCLRWTGCALPFLH